MPLFTRMRIGAKLATAFGAVIVIFTAVVVVAAVVNGRLAEADRWNLHTYKVLATGDDMLKSMINMETGTRGFLLAGDEKFLAPYTDGSKGFSGYWAAAKKLTSDNAGQQSHLDAMKQRHEEFRAVAESMIALRKDVTSGKVTMQAFVDEFAKARDKAAMDAFRELQATFDSAERKLLVTRSADADALRALSSYSMLFGSIAAIGLGAWLARGVTVAIRQPLQNAADVARLIAQGDLTSRIEATARDETGDMLRALSEMQAYLRQTVSQVRGSADSVATGSAQIAEGNQDLSSRTEEQASALQQTAATMDQLGTTVRNNADSAQQANQLAQGASAVAARGGQVVGQVVATMQGISDSSRRISDIIGVIDSIAFQTNILALNAAVEAARAGEQGRGFAVVASEVRSLAQRSADAAKEIKTLIGRSVEQVEQGTVLVDQAGKTMSEIVGSIQRVSDIVAEITSASAEQSTGVQQVGEAVSQMDHATQQNAALVEESAAAAESLKDQAQQLVQAVAVFKLPHDATLGAGHMAAKAAQAPRAARHSAPRDKNVPSTKPHAKPAAARAARPTQLATAAAHAGADDWASL